MPILLKEDYNYKLPKLFKVKQNFPNEKLQDVKQSVEHEIRKHSIASKIKPGQNVAVAVGSRGIKNISLIVKTVIDEIKLLGGKPYIISAMGSHGRATEEGQKEVLQGYGITEEKMGVPVITKLDVIKVGTTKNKIDVYFDKTAYEADMIIPINRVKLHTDFVGDLQSGMCKMLVIGLGNHKGCSSIHEEKPENFADIIEEAAEMIIKNTNVGFGVAIIENGYDQTTMVEAVTADKMISREKELIKIARRNMPYIMLDDIDVLVVEEIGKNISGAGFDPNILGRSSVLKSFTLHIPRIQKMVLLGLSKETHGNALGMGMFDIITKNVIDEAEMESVYANAIASKCIDDAKIPIIANDEDEAIRVALKVCRDIDRKEPRIVKIKNTLELEYIQVSESLLDEVRKNDRLEIQF